MNRRGMLSFLGIGAVGASTLGAQSGMNPVPSTQDSYWIDKKSYVDATPMVEDRATTLKRMQDDLFGLTSDPSKWIADRLAEEMKDWRMGYSGVYYANIDPDIRNMKSITETAKMRMYFERKVKRQAEMQQTSLTGRIAEYLGVNVR
jgi:hypothetical protein